MKIAIVHDYLNEFGGAERVLEVLTQMYPEAPIYTAFYCKGSKGYERFKHKDIRVSWAHYLPFFSRYLYSPLRFLAPLIWGSVAKKLVKYDVVITSSSWYITKGLHEKEICYCHTPSRWLYGYKTAKNWQKYALVRAYGLIVGHFLRLYDFRQAQKVKVFVANSEEVKKRIGKFYRRDAQVIYPPVNLAISGKQLAESKKENYYLIVSRLVGGKGIELGVKAAEKGKFELKIAGEGPMKIGESKYVELVGQVKDEKLANLYARAKGFLALSRDEDFGITPVEAMSAGTGVIAYNGGGYKETVVDGKTGVLFDNYSVKGLLAAIKKFDSLNNRTLHKECVGRAEEFSKKKFVAGIKQVVEKLAA